MQDVHSGKEAVDEKMLVRETGLTLCPTVSYTGASADGYVTCYSVDTRCCVALKIKRPFTIDNESVEHLTPHQIAEHFGGFVWSKERMACYI